MFGGVQKEANHCATASHSERERQVLEDMAKQQAQVAAPSAAPMPTQREQAMKMSAARKGHEHLSLPLRNKACSLKTWQQSSRRKSPRRLPRPCQCNGKAMKMFGGAQRTRRHLSPSLRLQRPSSLKTWHSSRRKSPRRLPRPCQRNASKR